MKERTTTILQQTHYAQKERSYTFELIQLFNERRTHATTLAICDLGLNYTFNDIQPD